MFNWQPSPCVPGLDMREDEGGNVPKASTWLADGVGFFERQIIAG